MSLIVTFRIKKNWSKNPFVLFTSANSLLDDKQLICPLRCNRILRRKEKKQTTHLD